MAKRTRRQFLADAARAAGGVSAAVAAGCFPGVGGQWAKPRLDCDSGTLPPVTGRSRVVQASSDNLVSEDPITKEVVINASEVATMLDRVLIGLAGGAGAPWPVLLPDCDASTRIGIKVNTLNGECATSVPLVQGLVASLRTAFGLSPEQIIVWDRFGSELSRAGFTSESVGATVLGTNALAGGGYEGMYCTVNGKMTRLSRILTELTDVTINCPVLKTHEVSGVTAALKNVYGMIDNPGDFHSDLATALPAIYAIQPIRTRIQLTIVDAIITVTLGGTSSPPDTFGARIFGSSDPLATDSHALALVNQLRSEKDPPCSGVAAELTSWLENGRALGLGALDYDLVES